MLYISAIALIVVIVPVMVFKREEVISLEIFALLINNISRGPLLPFTIHYHSFYQLFNYVNKKKVKSTHYKYHFFLHINIVYNVSFMEFCGVQFLCSVLLIIDNFRTSADPKLEFREEKKIKKHIL